MGIKYIYDDDMDLDWSQFSWAQYRTSEVKVLQPQLEKMGYEVRVWYTGDGDSFGPLTRCADVTKGEESFVFVYG